MREFSDNKYLRWFLNALPLRLREKMKQVIQKQTAINVSPLPDTEFRSKDLLFQGHFLGLVFPDDDCPDTLEKYALLHAMEEAAVYTRTPNYADVMSTNIAREAMQNKGLAGEVRQIMDNAKYPDFVAMRDALKAGNLAQALDYYNETLKYFVASLFGGERSGTKTEAYPGIMTDAELSFLAQNLEGVIPTWRTGGFDKQTVDNFVKHFDESETPKVIGSFLMARGSATVGNVIGNPMKTCPGFDMAFGSLPVVILRWAGASDSGWQWNVGDDQEKYQKGQKIPYGDLNLPKSGNEVSINVSQNDISNYTTFDVRMWLNSWEWSWLRDDNPVKVKGVSNADLVTDILSVKSQRAMIQTGLNWCAAVELVGLPDYTDADGIRDMYEQIADVVYKYAKKIRGSSASNAQSTISGIVKDYGVEALRELKEIGDINPEGKDVYSYMFDETGGLPKWLKGIAKVWKSPVVNKVIDAAATFIPYGSLIKKGLDIGAKFVPTDSPAPPPHEVAAAKTIANAGRNIEMPNTSRQMAEIRSHAADIMKATQTMASAGNRTRGSMVQQRSAAQKLMGKR